MSAQKKTAAIESEDLFACLPEKGIEVAIVAPEPEQTPSPPCPPTPVESKPRRKRGPVPTLGPTTGITLHLPTELVDQLHAAALAYNCTLKALCQRCLENGIKKAIKTHGELKGTPKKATSSSQVNL